ncbi:hypothetical protein DV737_g4728, partial [Chaetothyriales sp. CBS 132003]
MAELDTMQPGQPLAPKDMPQGSDDGQLLARSSVADHPKKRRRVGKPNSDKKFECKHEGCGKSYSRAEHLYRHQLNHTPKTIYRCDYPDCNRYFVRQDLCIRHRERHTTHGSQLHKRDSFAQSASQTSGPVGLSRPSAHVLDVDAQAGYAANPSSQDLAQASSSSTATTTTNGSLFPHDSPRLGGRSMHGISSTLSPVADQQPFASAAAAVPHANMAPPATNHNRVGSTGSNPLSPDQKQDPGTWAAASRRQSLSSSGHQHGGGQQSLAATDGRFTASSATAVPASPVRAFSGSSASTAPNWSNVRTHSDSAVSQRSTTNGFLAMADAVTPDAAFAAAVTQSLQAARTDPYAYPSMSAMPSLDLASNYNYPIFADEGNQLPFAFTDNFTAWLFNDVQANVADFSPSHFMPGYTDPALAQVQGPQFSASPSSSSSVRAGLQHPMSVTSILDSTEKSQYIMSEGKRQELLALMQTQFIERPHDAVKKRKESVFEGDVDADGHILSLTMMHTYIGSYWYHQHAQLPILHKPTFSADGTPNLLLLAVIAIGAATLDKAYGTDLTNTAAEFSNFVIWHLRWEIVRDADFRPPAKLWVFQALLLVEVYEKMYATRALHERSHIHHDSTLTLMRRGSSLLGRSASDTPPSGLRISKDMHHAEGSETVEQKRSEESWRRWIQTEATRRVAFGAFVLDSIHATMFGHAAKMVAHEMRLPLPCDEGLWSAVTPSEAQRVQSSLQTNGIRPTMFLDGLKRTLNGQRVRTNSFGRTIIMAGLLSVSWHMTQRDLQISSLGPRTATSFGGLDKWKSVLLRAFDNWKRDFDEALAESAPAPSSPTMHQVSPATALHLRPVDDENIFESRTVLHHLAHIAAHVDVVDCQVFAGANRLLGRSVTPKDYSLIEEKIRRWATKASARDAAFYALKFIAQVIVPPTDGNRIDTRHYGHASPILPLAFEQNQYIARDDFLLNRPWVLYISALVVWCYGYALEGPIDPRPTEEEFDTYGKREKDMMDFLRRVAGVRAPDDLENTKGKNRCLGLLTILKDSFESTRWELTHEAAGLLANACLKLKGIEDEDALGVLVGELGGKEGWDPYVGDGSTTGEGRVEGRREITVANAARV